MNPNIQTQEVDGWQIATNWTNAAKPEVTLKEIACNDTVVAWVSKEGTDGKVEFESEPAQISGYTKFRIPFTVLQTFMGVIETAQDVQQKQILFRGSISKPNTPRDQITLPELVAKYKRGEFDPKQWNLCIDWNSVDVGDETPAYTRCIGFYVMGDGCGQCEHQFHWPSEVMTKELLETWIKTTFNVDRVLYGVG